VTSAQLCHFTANQNKQPPLAANLATYNNALPSINCSMPIAKSFQYNGGRTSFDNATCYFAQSVQSFYNYNICHSHLELEIKLHLHLTVSESFS